MKMRLHVCVCCCQLLGFVAGNAQATRAQGALPVSGQAVEQARSAATEAASPMQGLPGQDSFAARSSQQSFPGGLDPDFADMALISKSAVTYTGYGILIQNRRLKPVSVVVHDSKGRLILLKNYRAASRLVTVMTGHLFPGVYVYTVKIGDKIHSKPFIIPR